MLGRNIGLPVDKDKGLVTLLYQAPWQPESPRKISQVDNFYPDIFIVLLHFKYIKFSKISGIPSKFEFRASCFLILPDLA